MGLQVAHNGVGLHGCNVMHRGFLSSCESPLRNQFWPLRRWILVHSFDFFWEKIRRCGTNRKPPPKSIEKNEIGTASRFQPENIGVRPLCKPNDSQPHHQTYLSLLNIFALADSLLGAILPSNWYPWICLLVYTINPFNCMELRYIIIISTIFCSSGPSMDDLCRLLLTWDLWVIGGCVTVSYTAINNHHKNNSISDHDSKLRWIKTMNKKHYRRVQIISIRISQILQQEWNVFLHLGHLGGRCWQI